LYRLLDDEPQAAGRFYRSSGAQEQQKNAKAEVSRAAQIKRDMQLWKAAQRREKDFGREM
jgi:hypothetical protein